MSRSSLLQIQSEIQGYAGFGVDLGKRFTGFAVSNSEQTLALPLKVVPTCALKRLAHRIDQCMKAHQATWVVLGLPLGSESRENPLCGRVRMLAEYLASRPVVLWDEGFSTFAARELRGGLKQSPKRMDAHAAAIILQHVLDDLQKHRSFH